ncbi:MAG: YggS family pyridoxal phosphate-dependent enzyme [Dehalococcoidales bacterium]|nr:YggS family pyridoxal phosphate-dependent enzyme [Dehalococcoidales bacterium]
MSFNPELIMIIQNVNEIFNELPGGVQLVAAIKNRTPEEIMEAVRAGIKILGENYIQEAEKIYEIIGKKAEWHFIGHLQKNKVKKAVKLFDMIETVDSIELAEEIDKRCAQISKVMKVLIEINSGKEEQKTGIFPQKAENLIIEISKLNNIRIMGLMTMGPSIGNPEESRPYFTETKKVFERIKILDLPNVKMKYLSMGMTNSYKVAIDEGANIIRIGSKIFGERNYKTTKNAPDP